MLYKTEYLIDIEPYLYVDYSYYRHRARVTISKTPNRLGLLLRKKQIVINETYVQLGSSWLNEDTKYLLHRNTKIWRLLEVALMETLYR